MKILIDTHIAIWSILDDPKLSAEARSLLLDDNNEIYYSAASIWEVIIKHNKYPDEIIYDGKFLSDACLDNGFLPINISMKHVLYLPTLHLKENSPRHKDPFDKILLAQAKAEGMKFMTNDELIPNYDEPFIIKI